MSLRDFTTAPNSAKKSFFWVIRPIARRQSPFPQLSTRPQLTLRDRGYRVCTCFAGTLCTNPQKDGQAELTWVAGYIRDGLLVCRRSPIHVLTGLSVGRTPLELVGHNWTAAACRELRSVTCHIGSPDTGECSCFNTRQAGGYSVHLPLRDGQAELT